MPCCYGILTSQQIARLDGGSQQKVLRILQLCFDRRLVDRPGAALFSSLSTYFDARPMAYALSRKGAHVLAGTGVEINVNLDRGTRNRRAVLIEHTTPMSTGSGRRRPRNARREQSGLVVQGRNWLIGHGSTGHT